MSKCVILRTKFRDKITYVDLWGHNTECKIDGLRRYTIYLRHSYVDIAGSFRVNEDDTADGCRILTNAQWSDYDLLVKTYQSDGLPTTEIDTKNSKITPTNNKYLEENI